ncbi:MAG: DUF4330 domain-containing protein [Oscillospiraceae bacterium]|nr:DUF4330 domain-containing protein [Oscillospiraceae bacterium]
MKIIDSKGRLFGKINLIDLLVILLIVAVVVAAVLRYLNTETANNKYDESLNRHFVYTTICRVVYKEIAENAKDEAGHQLMAGGELVDDCFITAVEHRPYYESYVDADGKLQHQVSDEFCDVVFTIEATAPFVNNAYKVGTQEVRVGRTHIVKTDTFEMTGTVVSLTEVEG